jgi:hypothetical protein
LEGMSLFLTARWSATRIVEWMFLHLLKLPHKGPDYLRDALL